MLRLAAHGIMSFSDKPLMWPLWLGLYGCSRAVLLVAALAAGAAGRGRAPWCSMR